jgi:phosphoribosyl 1,2-cyclic phosphodiesterase
VAHDGGEPVVVLDAGTGIRRVSHLLHGRAFHGSILLSHLHWDHTQGLPFFAAGDRADARVRVRLPDPGDGTTAADVFARAMSPPHFPIGPHGLLGDWDFDALAPGPTTVEGFDVLALDVPHKGGRTFGYRVSDGRSSIAYVPDHGPSELGPGPDGYGPYHENVLRLADGVDLLLHDSQHTAEELPSRAHYGHSAAEYAVGLGVEAGARTVVLFHHDPGRVDRDVDALLDRFTAAAVAVDAAAEEAVYDLG